MECVCGCMGVCVYLRVFGLDLSALPTGTTATVGDLVAFAPGIWYGNNSGIISGGAIGADKSLSDFFIRADRFAAPLFSVLTPPRTDGSRGRATIFSLDKGLETVMADNATALLIDDRLGYGALGLHHSLAELQLGYLFPGTEFSRTYTRGNQVLYRYHSASTGSVSRCALAVVVKAVPAPAAVATPPVEEGDVWGLIKAAWPLQQQLYTPLPSNGSEHTPSVASAREAIAATVTSSIFHAPTSNTEGPQLGISGRRLENGRVFSNVL